MVGGRRRPGLAALALCVTIGAAVAVVGPRLGEGEGARPSQAAAPERDVRATAVVRRRRLVREAVVNGTSKSGRSTTMTLPCADQGGVITRLAQPGSIVSLTTGSLVAEREGRPVLALVGEFAWYRDITVKSKGPDVSQFHAAAGAAGVAAPAGEIASKWTVEAGRAILGRAGYRLEGQRIDRCELLSVRPGMRLLAIRGRVGDTADRIKLVFASGRPWAEVSLGFDDAEWVRSGFLFVTRRKGRRYEGTVARVVRGRAQPGAIIHFAAGAAPPRGHVRGVIRRRGGATPRLTVPISAIYAEADGSSSVERLRRRRVERVRVDPERSVGGWVAVRTEGLRAGDRVVVGSP